MASKELSIKEREVVAHILDGFKIQDIAILLNISVRTVEAHKRNIYRKLGINNNIELCRYALENLFNRDQFIARDCRLVPFD